MPDHLPANFFAGAGMGVAFGFDSVCFEDCCSLDDVDLVECFRFGVSDCDGAGVGFCSSTIGAGNRCVVMSSAATTSDSRLAFITDLRASSQGRKLGGVSVSLGIALVGTSLTVV